MALTPENLQFVLFLSAPPNLTAVEFWQAAFGTLPDAFQKLGANGSHASGRRDDLVFSMNFNPNRVDIIVEPPPVNRPWSSGPAFFSNLQSAISAGTEALKVATKSLPQGTRPAVVFQAFEVATTAEEASRRVSELVPGVPQPNGSVESEYRVVQKLGCTSVSSLQIHKIFRCYSGQKIFLPHNIQPQETITLPSIQVVAYYVDVFTSPDRKVLPPQFDAVLTEIVTHAQATLSNGYDSLN